MAELLPRRDVLAGLAGVVGLAGLTGLAACGADDGSGPPVASEPTTSSGPTGRGGLRRRGVNYDVGTAYVPGYLSRRVWRDDLVQGEIEAIANDLHADSIILFGSEIDRFAECGDIAARLGLHVWVSPRLVGISPDGTLDHLVAAAEAAEALRAEHDEVGFITGCELTVFMAGLVTGETIEERAANLGEPGFQERLGTFLADAQGRAREVFGGEVTYSAGTWEQVDWSGFDVVGLNHYRGSDNQATYLADLRRAFDHGKPVVVTEFGCATHRGAEHKGGSGDDIVDWSTPTPTVVEGTVRDEQVQADLIVELLELFEAEGVDGAYAFQFIEPDFPHSPDPQHDLDMASYALVQVGPDGTDRAYETGRWAPKLAFEAVADRFA